MVEKLLFICVGLAAGLIGGLSQKIIWDWLKNRKDEGGQIVTHCVDHNDCVKKIESNQSCLTHVKQNIARTEQDITHMQKNLADGDASFRQIRTDITAIKVGVAAIATWLKTKGANIDDKDLF